MLSVFPLITRRILLSLADSNKLEEMSASSPTVKSHSSNNHVFVLGAGFTRAFVPSAPLLVDDFSNDQIQKKIENLQYASRLFEAERKRPPEGRINIERLMTRVYDSMPYDKTHRAETEFAILLEELQKALIHRIDQATRDRDLHEGILKFARHCGEVKATCITFNYDDYLDYALRVTGEWHPESGYGFFCRPASSTVSDHYSETGNYSSLNLLKLHGSINWRSKLGYSAPCPLESIVYLNEWKGVLDLYSYINTDVSPHLELGCVTVPPVLTKSSFVKQPVLQLVWTKAFEQLSSADRVTFIGYSFPPTDLAAASLFTEAMDYVAHENIQIVDFKEDNTDRKELQQRYCSILGEIPDRNFYFEGAVSWIERNL